MIRGLTVSVSVLALLACSGGGGGGNSPIPGTSALSAGFTGVSNPGANSVAMMPGAAQGDTIAVVVRLQDVTGLRSAFFDIVFDATALEFVGWSEGDALELSGQTPIYVANANTPGLLTVSVNLPGQGSVDVTGTRDLIELVFRVGRTGSFALQFESEALRDANQQTIGANWFSGTLTGN